MILLFIQQHFEKCCCTSVKKSAELNVNNLTGGCCVNQRAMKQNGSILERAIMLAGE